VLTRPQQILLKRAQSQAAISDLEYRNALEDLTRLPGCRSSKDDRLTDAHLDLFMAYFEAIFWRGVDGGILQIAVKRNTVFGSRGYWAAKNSKAMTSRDRFAQAKLSAEIAALEASLDAVGYGPAYCAAIKRKSGPGWKYKAALERTLHFKLSAIGDPF
jgi:hypothetical protein